MAKTITEIEESDIDLKGNPLHGAIYGATIVGALLLTAPTPPGTDKDEHLQKTGRASVAMMLNALERAGYSVTKRETVPAVFNDIFGGPFPEGTK